MEHRARRADGVFRWLHSRGQPLRDAEGRIVRWCIMLTDVDDRKRAEEALRASELNFRVIIDSIPGLVHTLTADGEVEFVNQQNLDYFGKTLEELRGWATSDVFHPDDLSRATEAWKHTQETGQPDEIECRLREGMVEELHRMARAYDGSARRAKQLLEAILLAEEEGLSPELFTTLRREASAAFRRHAA